MTSNDDSNRSNRPNLDDATLLKDADDAKQRLESKLDAIGSRAQDLVRYLAAVREKPEWEVAAQLWPEPLKWRNPDDPTDQWSGRGREPEWFTRWLKQDGNRIDLLNPDHPQYEQSLAKEMKEAA